MPEKLMTIKDVAEYVQLVGTTFGMDRLATYFQEADIALQSLLSAFQKHNTRLNCRQKNKERNERRKWQRLSL